MRFDWGEVLAMTRKEKEAESDRAKDPLLVEIGRRVRERRKALGLSQYQMSGVCGIQQNLVFSTEAGLQNLTLKTLAKFAKGLNTTVRDLMPESQEIPELERPSTQNLTEVLEALDRVTQQAARLTQLAIFMHAQVYPPTPGAEPQGKIAPVVRRMSSKPTQND